VVDRAGNESVRSAVTDARPPAAPKYLVASAGDDLVHLEWDAVEAVDLDSYSVRRAENPGGPYAVLKVGVTGNTYIDHGATGGRTYYYVVTAVDGSSNESAFSNESSAAPVRATATTGVSARR
jgi:fibronectin type 3 domain-containing protein